MALLSTFSSACDLANRLPGLVASFIDLEVALGRRFREDSLSDLVIASFLQIPALPVVVLTPNEKRTGSDFDLALLDTKTHTAIQYRVQCKRLGAPTARWQTRSYTELAHPNETGQQVRTLCDLKILGGSIPTIPLYAFYNPESVCTLSGVPGIALADAFEVEQIVLAALAKKPRPLFKRITRIQPLFFQLNTILCPPTKGHGRQIATPQESRDAFEQIRAQRSRTIAGKLKSDPVPPPGEIPDNLYSAFSATDRGRVQRASVDRPQILILTSGLLQG